MALMLAQKFYHESSPDVRALVVGRFGRGTSRGGRRASMSSAVQGDDAARIVQRIDAHRGAGRPRRYRSAFRLAKVSRGYMVNSHLNIPKSLYWMQCAWSTSMMTLERAAARPLNPPHAQHMLGLIDYHK
jgi:hypothetical protein